MCRMFMLSGDFAGEFPDIFRCLQHASVRDPYPDPDSDYRHLDHSDGWGMVNTGKFGINYFRSPGAVYRSNVPAVQEGYIIVHSRNASAGQPRGTLHSHPFSIRTAGGQAFLAHNGVVDKSSAKIAEAAGSLTEITDSEALLAYLAERVRIPGKGILERLEGLEDDEISHALVNVFALELYNGADGIAETSAWYFTDKGGMGNAYEKADRLYIAGTDRWNGVFSSSLLSYDEFPDTSYRKEVGRGSVYKL